ncbi:MAG TPA: pyrroloquinoline quinone biosynthesis protein PqqE [Candidatus Methylacidiphilales bacterium]
MIPRPYVLLAELTYGCPLHCPYCSNPVGISSGAELGAEEWKRVFQQAAALGVLHVGLSGGEPLLRHDLPQIIGFAREAGLYTNLITSGLGLDLARAQALRASGLDSIQISFQADEAPLADVIAGTKAHRHKLEAARAVTDAGLPLSLNIVLHRRNVDRLEALLALAERLGAQRLELANVQFYGWALLNRDSLLPTRDQVRAAFALVQSAKKRLEGRMEIIYVLPDYFEERPKPCMQGWGQRYLTVNPIGQVLPCPNAGSIPDLAFENVREQSLEKIWKESASFNRFRGEAWMPLPCRECPERAVDFGGCRCQAALLTGDPSATDPVCSLSPHHAMLGNVTNVETRLSENPSWQPRQNPQVNSARSALRAQHCQPHIDLGSRCA